MRPVYTAAYSACDACTTCSVPAVTPTSYVQASPTCCAAGPVATEPTPAVSQPAQTFGGSQPPALNPSDATPTNRMRQSTEGAGNSGTPATGTSSGNESSGGGAGTNPAEDPLEKYLNEKETYFRAPDLFNPNSNDKTVQQSVAPVNLAVYKRPAGSPKDRVTTRPITFEKAQRDAVGWTSASR
jgi:hypothetical protein